MLEQHCSRIQAAGYAVIGPITGIQTTQQHRYDIRAYIITSLVAQTDLGYETVMLGSELLTAVTAAKRTFSFLFVSASGAAP